MIMETNILDLASDFIKACRDGEIDDIAEIVGTLTIRDAVVVENFAVWAKDKIICILKNEKTDLSYSIR